MSITLLKKPTNTSFVKGDSAAVHRVGDHVVRISHPVAAQHGDAMNMWHAHRIARALMPREKGEVLHISSANAEGLATSRHVDTPESYRQFVELFYRHRLDAERWKKHPHYDAVNKAAHSLWFEMFAKGVALSTAPVNVAILPDGRLLFFEVDCIFPHVVRNAAEKMDPRGKKHVLSLLDQYDAFRKRLAKGTIPVPQKPPSQ